MKAFRSTTLLTCSRHMSTFAASATLHSGKSPAWGRSLITTLLRIVHQLNDPLSSICFILRGRLKSRARGLARRGASLSDIRARRAVRHDTRRPWRIHPPPNFRTGAFDDPEFGSRKVDGVGAPAPRPAPAVVTELRPQPAAAVPGACRWAGAEGARDAPPIPGDAQPRSEDHWAPARVGRSGLRSQRRGLLAVDTRCAGSVHCWTATGSSRWQRFADRLPSGTKPNASSSILLLLRIWTGPCS